MPKLLSRHGLWLAVSAVGAIALARELGRQQALLETDPCAFAALGKFQNQLD